jgi:hypothetical protein
MYRPALAALKKALAAGELRLDSLTQASGQAVVSGASPVTPHPSYPVI